MSTLDLEQLRHAVVTWAESDPGGYPALARRLPAPAPTAEAIRLFALGRTKRPSFASDLADVLYGEARPVDAQEELATALRLVREAESALLRVTERLRADELRQRAGAAIPPVPSDDLAGSEKPPRRRRQG